MAHAATGLLMKRVVNPVVRRLLRTPVHDLLGDHVAVLTWTGRRSGRAYSTPVNAVLEGPAVTVLTRRGRSWWRNLVGGADVELLLEGRPRRGRASVLELGHADRAVVIARTFAALGRPLDPAKAASLPGDAVVVRIVLEPDAAEAAPVLRGWPLWRRWAATVTAGEALGFAVPALVLGLLVAAGAPDGVLVPFAILAGAVEGAVLGVAQALVVRRAFPQIRSRDWVRATALGAAVAWAIGTIPMLFGGLQGVPGAVLVLVGIPAALTLLLAIGVLQWRVLRAHVPGAGAWIGANAMAWLVALTAFAAVTSPLWHTGQAAGAAILVGILGGLVMAATMAAILGLELVRLAGAHGVPSSGRAKPLAQGPGPRSLVAP